MSQTSSVMLSTLRPGARARIVRVAGKGPVHRRIMDMGVVPGTLIEMKRVAPLGDPIEVIVRGYHLSLRKEEAGNVYVEVT